MLNKIFTICSSVFLIISLTVWGYADEHFPFLAEVSKESVNVRAGANINFEKIDKLNRGAEVVVLGRSYEWYQIQPLATTKSYIRSDYLKIKEGGLVAEVLGDNVNVRASPNAEAASLGELKKGTFVKVLEQVRGWCRLAPVAGTFAWIHQDFLKLKSADVPASMLIQPVQWPSVDASTAGNVIVNDNPLEVAPVSLRGQVEPLSEPPEANISYELMVDGKPVYYLQDIPQMSLFSHAVVDVKGDVTLNPQKKLMYPLLHITRISLVL